MLKVLVLLPRYGSAEAHLITSPSPACPARSNRAEHSGLSKSVLGKLSRGLPLKAVGHATDGRGRGVTLDMYPQLGYNVFQYGIQGDDHRRPARYHEAHPG